MDMSRKLKCNSCDTYFTPITGDKEELIKCQKCHKDICEPCAMDRGDGFFEYCTKCIAKQKNEHW